MKLGLSVLDKWQRWICLLWLLLVPLPGNAVTPMIAAGADNSLFLNGDGSIWRTGGVTATSPVRRFQLANIVAVAAGSYTDFALTADGVLWGTGLNSFGELGDGTTERRFEPQQVLGMPRITAIEASGWGHVLALKQDGTVLAWGRNMRGELGDGTTTERHLPVPVAGLTNITRISAGFGTSLALKSDGTVWVWGFTCCGAAGNGLSAAGTSDPEWNHLVPTQVLDLDRVVAISAGDTHHLALRADGTVWSWGRGDHGENGIGAAGLAAHALLPVQVPGLEQVVAIEARSQGSSLALKADGTVWAWGNNNAGQLGMSGITYSASPIQVPGLSDVAAIAKGNGHTLAMRRDGSVLAWGGNSNGQLGDKTLDDRSQPRAVVGPGGSGQLNLVQPAPSSFNQLPSALSSLSVSSGSAPLTVQAYAADVSDPDGNVMAYYWKTSDGQRVSGSSATFVFAIAGTYRIDLLVEDNAGGRGGDSREIVVTPAAAVAISTTAKVGISGIGGIALARDGHVLTWGANWALGLSNSQARLSLPLANSLPMANGVTGAVDFVVGGSSDRNVLLADGTVLGWGSNESGQVGSGSTADTIFEPQLLANLPPVQSIAAGSSHRLALTRDGRVFTWGANTSGQLGVGDNQNRLRPAEVTGLTNVAALVGGWGFSAALKADGTVWAWGDNSYGQLGDGTRVSRNQPVQVPGLAGVGKIFATYFALYAQKADGTVWAVGFVPLNTSLETSGPGAAHMPSMDNAVQIAGGAQHLVVLKPDGTVWTGGRQSTGALGFMGSSDVLTLTQLPGVSDVISVAAGLSAAMALRRDGTVLAWGLNNYGQIGDGTLAFQQTPALVVNEAGNGFLDLIPEGTNTIPRDKIPPFFLAAYLNGGLGSTTLYADLKGITPGGAFASSEAGRFAAGYNVYVAANVPGIAAAPYFQLNANNSWSALNWPMTEFLRAVALDSQNALVRAQILQNTDLSVPALAGASILVGYGIDADEMLQSARYRTVFTVPQP